MENADITGEPDRTGERLLTTVVELLENDGYDAVQLREVARRARISLTTIYKRYATREELILAAIEHWMKSNYTELATQSRDPGEPLHPAMMRVIRAIFEPWEQHPEMLFAYFRVRAAPGGESLAVRGFDPVVPIGMAVLSDVDPEFVAELESILSSVVYGLVGRCNAGYVDITEIVPTIDRTVFWLTTGYQASLRDE
ncbi:TetR/AcrR family transcriptional regulator [Rhodococcus sp. HNM0563]|uniref:TetR family transcriptional regulator n=1 Tax=Rhodococcus sp. HNM0563 TaxID=2716339 RepID=UPI00146AABA2|nr:TetR family transcriptional regulator [Rhodococcus sp. HNM0563]NLU63825.1 TetR/AcrR family transcriptional regulator [Rhodococcus sp. HNM0563]